MATYVCAVCCLLSLTPQAQKPDPSQSLPIPIECQSTLLRPVAVAHLIVSSSSTALTPLLSESPLHCCAQRHHLPSLPCWWLPRCCHVLHAQRQEQRRSDAPLECGPSNARRNLSGERLAPVLPDASVDRKLPSPLSSLPVRPSVTRPKAFRVNAPLKTADEDILKNRGGGGW